VIPEETLEPPTLGKNISKNSRSSIGSRKKKDSFAEKRIKSKNEENNEVIDMPNNNELSVDKEID
jgi:hypothetical protein